MLRKAEGRKAGSLHSNLCKLVHFVFQMTRQWHSQYHFHLLQRNFWSLCAKMFHFKLSVWPATRPCVPTWSLLPISGLYCPAQTGLHQQGIQQIVFYSVFLSFKMRVEICLDITQIYHNKRRGVRKVDSLTPL